MAFPEKKPIQKESLTFTNNDSGGLPNYFGDAPQPIEINGKKKPRSRSQSKSKNKFGISAGPKFKKPQKKAEPVVKREKASTGWNNNNVPESKFFDKT